MIDVAIYINQNKMDTLPYGTPLKILEMDLELCKCVTFKSDFVYTLYTTNLKIIPKSKLLQIILE